MEETIIKLEQALKEAGEAYDKAITPAREAYYEAITPAEEAYDKAIVKSMRVGAIARTVRLAKLLDKEEGK